MGERAPLNGGTVSDARELLSKAYARFNARDLEGVLSLMHPDVDWPNGWEGGRVYGHAGVRAYWSRQWAALDPQVEPIGFDTHPNGSTVVTVHQVVRDLTGAVLSDGTVEHAYEIEDGLIRKMDIGRGRLIA